MISELSPHPTRSAEPGGHICLLKARLVLGWNDSSLWQDLTKSVKPSGQDMISYVVSKQRLSYKWIHLRAGQKAKSVPSWDLVMKGIKCLTLVSNIISFSNTWWRRQHLCYPQDCIIPSANINQQFTSESHIYCTLLFTAHVRQDSDILRGPKLHYYFLSKSELCS